MAVIAQVIVILFQERLELKAMKVLPVRLDFLVKQDHRQGHVGSSMPFTVKLKWCPDAQVEHHSCGLVIRCSSYKATLGPPGKISVSFFT